MLFINQVVIHLRTVFFYSFRLLKDNCVVPDIFGIETLYFLSFIPMERKTIELNFMTFFTFAIKALKQRKNN